MSFTGEAVRQGNSDRFGVGSPGSIPRAFVSFRNQPYIITRDALAHITDLANGSGVLIQNNAEYNLDDSDPTCGFVWNDRMYFLDRDDDVLAIFDDPLNGDVSVIGFFSGIDSPSAAATDGTTVWIYDAPFDTIYTIDPATATTTSLGPVGFDVTTPANNIAGMFYHGGRLYLLDNGTELMFVIDDISAVTLEATAVDVDIVEFGASQRGVNGGGVHLGEAYMTGGNPDALYRFYNVRWDEIIDAIEVDEGGNDSLDLSTVSKDATSFEFAPSNLARSWLTISGMELVITNAPDVTSDTDFEVQVRAIRGSKYEEKTLTVRVQAIASPTPVWLSPAQLVGSVTAGEASRTFNIASLVDKETSITDVSGVPSWGSFDGTDLVLEDVPETDTVQTITISFNAINDIGTTPGDFILTWNPLLVVWDANLAETIGPNVTRQIDISALAPNADTIEATSTLESWITFDGTHLDITDSPELTTDTDYTVSFRARRGGQAWVTADYVLTVRKSMLPTWVIAAQRVGSVTAGTARKTFNIAAFVEDETSIETVRGVPAWASFDGTELVLENVPDTDSVQTHRITFLAKNGDGSVNANFVLTHTPLLVSWSHVSRRMQSLAGGTSADINISTLAANADTIEVVSGQEHFMNFFGQVLEIRNAPRVTVDTQYTVRFRAKRGGQAWVEANFVLTVTIAVTFANAEELRKTLASGAIQDIDLTEIVENADELEVVSGLESWMAYRDRILQITRAPIVTESTDFRIQLRARRDMGAWTEAEYLLTLRPSTFLPPNATQLERDFEAALARREVILFDGANRDPRDNNVPARNTWNPDKIASPLLPYLANAMSVDVWNDAWDDAIKRQVIKDSYLVHSKKGTVQSIRDLLNSLGFRIAVINEGDADSWANYSVTLNYTVTIAQGQAIITALEAVAPIRSTLTGLHVQSNTHIWDGTIRFDGTFSFGQIIQLI